MTERLFHAGIAAVLWHDREGGIYIVNIPGHPGARIEASSYEAAVAQFAEVAEGLRKEVA